MKIGDLVRFNHEQNGGPVHRIASVMSDGMVELHDMGGYFAPHLFALADDIADIPPSPPLPAYTKESLTEWADKIDGRIGPISGRDADALARLLRATAMRMRQLQTDRDDQDRALRDAISETAGTADELAFWRYQAIWGRTYLLQPAAIKQPFMEDGPAWKEAIRQLEAARVAENAERMSHA